MTPDLIFHGGRLLDAPRAARTAMPGRGAPLPKGSASHAVWVRDGRIHAVGSLSSLRARAGRRAKSIDLKGGTLTPGFTDSHIHLITWIRAVGETWLDEQTAEAIARAVGTRKAAAPHEEWILIRGFVPRDWQRRSRSILDAIAPDRPLVLYAVDGHSVWANSAALARAGVDEGTPPPAGGVIERDSSGALTGYLAETADKPVRAAVVHGEPAPAALARALARARSLGITSAHDFDRSATWRAAQELERDERLGFRLLLSVPLASLDDAVALGLQSRFGTEQLRIGPVKMFADGTLGSATALLEDPYEKTASVGIEVTGREVLAQACVRAAENGLSVAIHAIGDAAVRNALDAIEAPLKRGLSYPLPPRVEHVQLARSLDVARFRSLGVLASVQPIHQVTDREVARRHWGDRTARSYAWKSLAEAGADLIFGSDAPFDRPGPLLAIQAALLRRAPGDPESASFHSEQRLPLGAALRAHLEEPQRAAGWRTRLGRLSPGYGADLVHFNEDLLRIPIESWHQVKVRGVWVGGTSQPVHNS